MLRLTLVRHAKATPPDGRLADFERPLDPRGRRDATLMALRVRDAGAQPDRLVSSPALRAITTARLFAQVFGLPAQDIDVRSRIYDAALPALVDVVRALDPAVRHAMLFGHNPGFSELARWLAPCPFDEVPTCAVVQLELHIDDWRAAASHCGSVLDYLCPDDGAG